MKNVYENVKMEVIAFEVEDIITTSATEVETKGDLSDFVVPGGDTFNGSDLF